MKNKPTNQKTLIVANWKMNLDMQEASLYLHKLAETVKNHKSVEVVLAPTIFTLQSLSMQIDLRQFKLAAQNFYWRDHGSFTGEVSATQLRGIVQYGLVGHSERRYLFGETDKDVRAKVQAALRNKITPILCIGETALERSSEEVRDVIYDQLLGGLANVSSDELDKVVIAYEPVWAIGTGEKASPLDVKLAVKLIRQQLVHLYGKEKASLVRVLYGGSVDSSSAAEYLAIDGVSGLVVGKASLDGYDLSKINEIAYEINQKKQGKRVEK